MKRAIFLYNPQSGRERAGARSEAVCAVFREQGYEIEAQPIDFAVNPFEGNEQLDLMVVAGGDGSVNYVLNCMKRKELDIPVGIIPAGTANDFAGALGMSRNAVEAARQIATGEIERVDCGRVNGLYYVNIFSFGVFTTTSQRTSDDRKHRLGKLAYLLEGSKEIRNMRGVPLQITADGRTFEAEVLLALIFNGETAGGFRLARKASIRDGLFDCILLERRGAFRSLWAMLHYLVGGHPHTVRHIRAAELEVISPVDVPTDVDGQPGVHFPLHVECLHGALRVVVPRRK